MRLFTSSVQVTDAPLKVLTHLLHTRAPSIHTSSSSTNVICVDQ